MAEFKVVSIKY